jgi:hypothetical protein
LEKNKSTNNDNIDDLKIIDFIVKFIYLGVAAHQQEHVGQIEQRGPQAQCKVELVCAQIAQVRHWLALSRAHQVEAS